MRYLLLALLMFGACATDREGYDLYYETENYCDMYQRCDRQKFDHYFEDITECSDVLGEQVMRYMNTVEKTDKCGKSLETYYKCMNKFSCDQFEGYWTNLNNGEHHSCYREKNDTRRVCDGE